MLVIITDPNLPRLQVGVDLNVWSAGKIVGAVRIESVDPKGRNAYALATLNEGYRLPNKISISVEKSHTSIYVPFRYYIGLY